MSSLIGGVILSVSQSPIDLGVVALLALVPLCVAVRGSGSIEAVLLGISTGLAYGLTSGHWLFSAFEAQGTVGIQTLLATFATILWGKGLLFGALGGLMRSVRSLSIGCQVVLPATLFGLAELWMSDSLWGFPICLLGHSQLSVPGVAQLAVAIGVPGISALLIALNTAFSFLVENQRCARPLAVALTAGWVALALFGVPITTLLRPAARVELRSLLIIQPEIPRDLRWDPVFQNVILDQIAAQTTQALESTKEPPDVILWPENLFTTPFTADKRLETRFQSFVDGWKSPVVTGLVRPSTKNQRGTYRNAVIWWSPRIGLRDVVEKVRAVPLVESNRRFIGRALLASIVGAASRGPHVEEADVSKPLVGEFTLSPALCFEALFPRLVAERRNDRSVAIINLADDSWVPGEVADAQLVSAAAFRAIEQRLTLVRVSHGGLSVVIDQYGRSVASLPANESAHMTAHVSASPPPSIVERIAILALPVSIGFGTWLGMMAFSRRDRRVG